MLFLSFLVYRALFHTLSLLNFHTNKSHKIIFSLLGCYAAYIGGWLLTFQDNISVPSMRVKHSMTPWPLKMGLRSCPKTSVIKYQSTLRNNPEEQTPYLHHGRRLLSCRSCKVQSRERGGHRLWLNMQPSKASCSALKLKFPYQQLQNLAGITHTHTHYWIVYLTRCMLLQHQKMFDWEMPYQQQMQWLMA
jgi:hypothetical protein